MSPKWKRNYNKAYYQKNRSKILKRKRTVEMASKPSKMVSLKPSVVEPPVTSKLEGRPLLVRISGILLGCLIVAMTYFLLRESARFYFTVEGNLAESYLKAFILEGSALALCILPTQTPLAKISSRLLIGFIYVYSLWVVSGSVLHKAAASHQEISYRQTAIRELEGDVAKFEAFQKSLWNSDRISAARTYDAVIGGLKLKLESERKGLVQTPKTEVVWNTLAMLVVFRILVILSNLFCLGYASFFLNKQITVSP